MITKNSAVKIQNLVNYESRPVKSNPTWSLLRRWSLIEAIVQTDLTIIFDSGGVPQTPRLQYVILLYCFKIRRAEERRGRLHLLKKYNF